MSSKYGFDFSEIAVKRIYTQPDKPTIIFLHDSLGCIELWRDFPEKMSQETGFNVLVYDRQGYGKSCSFIYEKRDKQYLDLEADILNDLMAYWGLNDAILFGHSDGGTISLIMAGKYPEKVKAVITEGCHIFVDDLTIKGINAAVYQYENSNLRERIARYHGDKTEMIYKLWVDTWREPSYADWSIEYLLPNIECKTLVIQGYNDEFGTEAQVDGIVKAVPGLGEKWMIEGVGHNPHKEVPELVLEKSKKFLKNI